MAASDQIAGTRDLGRGRQDLAAGLCRTVARTFAGCAAGHAGCVWAFAPCRAFRHGRAPRPRISGRSRVMKLVSFHLMPYRPLDLTEAAKYRSPWVVLPTSLYDPIKGAEEYARHIDALVYA